MLLLHGDIWLHKWAIDLTQMTWKGMHFLFAVNMPIHFLKRSYRIFIQTSLEIVSKDSFDNNSALTKGMDFGHAGGMPLPEPMGTQFMGRYMCPRAAELIVDESVSALNTRQQTTVNNLTTSDVAPCNHYVIAGNWINRSNYPT